MNPIENRQPAIDKALKSLEDFRLKKLELFNKEKTNLTLRTGKNRFFILVAFIVLCVGSFFFPGEAPNLFFSLLVLLALLLDSGSETSKIHLDAYQLAVKKNLIEAFFPNIQYTSNGYYFKQKVEDSLLIKDTFVAKNHFKGQTANGYFFEFAEVENGSLLENGEIRFFGSRVGFKGFLFTITSPDISCQKIIILKKTAVHNRNLKGLKQVDISVILPTLDASYAVFSQNEFEAEKLITADFLKPIEELAKKWNGELLWSFIGSQIYVAIRTGKDLFEPPSLLDSVYANDWSKKYYERVAPYLEAIEETSLQLEQIPEKTKIEIKEYKINPLDDNSPYNHLVE